MCSKAKMYKEYFNESKKKCMIKKECKKDLEFFNEKTGKCENKPKCKNGERFDDKKGIYENKKCLSDLFYYNDKTKNVLKSQIVNQVNISMNKLKNVNQKKNVN